MKRDMDLVREILLTFEAGRELAATHSHTEAEILHHLAIMTEAGLLHGQVILPDEDFAGAAMIERLTWHGHDFLAAARDQTVWNQVKRTVLDAGKSWTLEGLKRILFDLAGRAIDGHL